MSAEEEIEICRVCHCGDEDDPLYHPCNCSGTIRYIHQECLLQWLRHKGSEEKRCELCGSEFQFTPVYRNGETAPVLSAWCLTSALLPRVASYIYSASSAFVKFLMWFLVIPLFSSFWIDICCAVASARQAPWLIFTQLRLDVSALLSFKLVAHWWSGFLSTTVAVLFGLGVLQIAGAVLTALMHPRADLGAAAEDGGEPRGVPGWIQHIIGVDRHQDPLHADPIPADADAGQDLDNNGDIVLPEIELSAKKWLFVISFVAVVIVCATVFPVLLGRCLLEILSLPQWLERGCRAYLHEVASTQGTAWFDAKILLGIFSSSNSILVNKQASVSVDEMSAAALADHLWPHILLTLEALAGVFLVIATASFCALFALFRHYYEERCKRESADNTAAALIREMQAAEATEQIAAPHHPIVENNEPGVERAALLVCGWIKTTIAVLFDGLLLPQATGWLIGLLTMRAVGVRLQERVNTCLEIPILCAVAHWGFGLLFMLHIAHMLLELRELLHPEVLVNILPERHLDREERAVDFFARRSFAHLFRKMATSAIIMILAVFASVFLPVQIGHWTFFGIISPLRLRFEDAAMQVQLPVEVVIFHLFVPLLLERLRHREFIRETLSAILSHSCKWLDLTDILDPRIANHEEDQDMAGVLQHVERLLHRARAEVQQAQENAEQQLERTDTLLVPSSSHEANEHEESLPDDKSVLVAEEDEGDWYSTDSDCSDLEMDHIFAYIKANSPPRASRGGVAAESRTYFSELPQEDETHEHCASLISNPEVREDIFSSEANLDPDNNGTLPATQPALNQGSIVPTIAEVEERNVPDEMTTNSVPLQSLQSLLRAYISRPVRIAVLCCLLTFTMTLSTVLAVHLPLEIGRLVFRCLNFPIGHDLYNYATGIITVYGMFRFTFFVCNYVSQRDLRVENMHRNLAMCVHSIGIFLKWAILAVIWLVFPPLLIGCLLEAVIVVPLRTAFNETPVYPISQCWALGLIFLKIWVRTVLVGAFGENRFRAPLEVMVHNGIYGLDAMHALCEIIGPVLSFLGDLYLTPYFCARIFCMLYPGSYLLQTFVMRYCYLFYICVKLLGSAFSAVRTEVSKLHDEIRDELYLERQQLTNR